MCAQEVEVYGSGLSVLVRDLDFLRLKNETSFHKDTVACVIFY